MPLTLGGTLQPEKPGARTPRRLLPHRLLDVDELARIGRPFQGRRRTLRLIKTEAQEDQHELGSPGCHLGRVPRDLFWGGGAWGASTEPCKRFGAPRRI